MKTKTIKITGIALFGSMLLFSCAKNKCAECHYDYQSTLVEIGEKCGDSLKAVEANGIIVNDTLYEVHCHEH
jgi:hypothetical protein